MAVTFTPLPVGGPSPNGPHAIGDMWAMVGVITYSGSYATGGDTLTLPSLNPGVGNAIAAFVDDTAGYGLRYIVGGSRIMIYSAAGTELAAGAYPAALSGSSSYFLFLYQ